MIWRRARGVLGIASVWAVAWLPIGLLLGLVGYWREGPINIDVARPPGHFLSHMANSLGLWTLAGAVSGASFAVILAVAERNRALSSLSIRRLAIWGGIGASLVPAALLALEALQYTYTGWWSGATVIVAIAAALGAGSGAATLRLAGRARHGQLGP